MKELPILMSADMVRAILEGRKTQTRRVVTPHNSIIGEGGDWKKLDFYGKEILDKTLWAFHKECPKGSLGRQIADNGYKILAWVDNGISNWQYLHVPYNWHDEGTIYRVYPRYEIGDRLWCKETWKETWLEDRIPELKETEHGCVHYKATGIPVINESWTKAKAWRPSIFMPRWASRITLEITGVGVQRVQEITEADVDAEGTRVWLNEHPDMLDNAPFSAQQCYSYLWDSINGKKYPWASNPWVWVISFKKLARTGGRVE